VIPSFVSIQYIRRKTGAQPCAGVNIFEKKKAAGSASGLLFG